MTVVTLGDPGSAAVRESDILEKKLCVTAGHKFRNCHDKLHRCCWYSLVIQFTRVAHLMEIFCCRTIESIRNEVTLRLRYRVCASVSLRTICGKATESSVKQFYLEESLDQLLIGASCELSRVLMLWSANANEMRQSANESS